MKRVVGACLKIMAIYLLLYVLGFALIALADFITGLSLKESINRFMDPFGILTAVEYILIPVAVSFPLLPVLIHYWKNKRSAQKK